MRIDKGRTPWFPRVHVFPVRDADWKDDEATIDAVLQAAWEDLGGWDSGIRLTYGELPRRPWIEVAFAWVGCDLTWKPRTPAGISCSMLSRPLTVGTEMVARGVHLDLKHLPTLAGVAGNLAHEIRHLCGMPAHPHPVPESRWTPAMTRFGAERWYEWAGPDWGLAVEMGVVETRPT